MDSLELIRAEIANDAFRWLEDKEKNGQNKDHFVKMGAEKFFSNNASEKAQFYNRIMNSNCVMEALREYMNINPLKAMELLYDIGLQIEQITTEENEQVSSVSKIFQMNVNATGNEKKDQAGKIKFITDLDAQETDIPLLAGIAKAEDKVVNDISDLPTQNIEVEDLSKEREKVTNLLKHLSDSSFEQSLELAITNDPEEKTIYDVACSNVSGGFKEKLEAYLDKNQEKLKSISKKINDVMGEWIAKYKSDAIEKGVASYLKNNPDQEAIYNDTLSKASDITDKFKNYLLKNPDKIQEILKDVEESDQKIA